MTRPEKKIDWQRTDELLEAGCPGTEIAAFFGMHPDTFYLKFVKERGMGFSDYSAQKKSTGEALIREAQYLKAIKAKDNTLLIWLGKQRLNQRETPVETEVSPETTKRYLEVIHQLASLQQNASAPQLASSATPVEKDPPCTLEV